MNLTHGLSSMLDPLAAWIATYCLHSTVLLGIAWIVTRGTGRPAVHEAIWRIAFSAGLLTAGLQHLLGSGSWIWPTVSTPPSAGVAVPSEAFVALPSSMSTLGGPAEMAAASVPWSGWWLAGLGVAVCFGLLRLAGAAWRLRRGLRGRVELVEGPLRRELDELLVASGRAAGTLRLTLAPALDVPVALGVLRPEIAVPRWAAEALDRAEQRSLLAHELAHWVRGDTVWRPAAALAAALLPFQPLNHLAVARLEHLSEDLADDWARRRSAGVSLARCLTQAADHLLGRRSLPVAAMASPSSDLSRRVRRLLAPPRSTGRSLPASALVIAIAGVALAMATLAPGWATVPEAPPAPPEPPTPASAPQPPTLPSAPQPRIAPDTPPAPPEPASPRSLERWDVAPRPVAPPAPRFSGACVAPTLPAAPRFSDAVIAPSAPATPRFPDALVAPSAPQAPRFPDPLVAPIAPAAPAAPVPKVEADSSATPAAPRAPEPVAVPWVPRAPGVPEALVPWVAPSEPDDC